MTEQRAFITVRATGQRLYLDDPVEPAQARAVKTWLESGANERLRFQCDVCLRDRVSSQFRQADIGSVPLICFSCSHVKTGLGFHEVPWPDHVFLSQAHGVLKALRTEVKHGRRAVVAG